VASYGADAISVLDLIAERRDLGLTLIPDLPYLRAEVVYGARFEGAQTLEDVLQRRTRVAWEDREGGRAAASPAADLLADELDWDSTRRDCELETYLNVAAADRAAWTGAVLPVAGVEVSGSAIDNVGEAGTGPGKPMLRSFDTRLDFAP
jgi:hypothetical protein